jgi:hypothetical protein
MKFVLEIELGNDAMQTGTDVLRAIRESLKGEEGLPLDAGTAGILWDENGNTVGKWEVKRDLSAALDAAAQQYYDDAHAPDSPSAAPEPLRSAAAFIAECDRRKAQGNPPPAPDDPYWNKAKRNW